MKIDNATGNLVVESSITSIKATIHQRKQWGWFSIALPEFLLNLLWFLFLVLLLIVIFMQKYFIFGIVLLFLFGLYLLYLYSRAFETLKFLFDKETIEVDDQSITIERSGFLGLKRRKVFSAKNIKGLTVTSTFSMQGKRNFLGGLSRLPFISSNLDAFMIWHGRGSIWRGRGPRRFSFGTGVAQPEAQNFLKMVYMQFPKYQYTRTL